VGVRRHEIGGREKLSFMINAKNRSSWEGAKISALATR